ncbi:MAG: Hsp20/alpha crystallin family protein [Saprospiraceae bacterium]|nr:Hsp20/alpha crystallin family protein [Saprospiraceae bacterium]
MFPVKSFSNVIDEIFSKGLNEFSGNLTSTNPSVNIKEDKDSYIIDVAAPGLEKQDFNLSLEKDHLIISASKENSQESEEEGKWTRKEFNFSAFRRSFYIPETVDAENITAEYDKGILSVKLAKKEEVKEKAPKQIAIK